MVFSTWFSHFPFACRFFTSRQFNLSLCGSHLLHVVCLTWRQFSLPFACRLFELTTVQFIFGGFRLSFACRLLYLVVGQCIFRFVYCLTWWQFYLCFVALLPFALPFDSSTFYCVLNLFFVAPTFRVLFVWLDKSPSYSFRMSFVLTRRQQHIVYCACRSFDLRVSWRQFSLTLNWSELNLLFCGFHLSVACRLFGLTWRQFSHSW